MGGERLIVLDTHAWAWWTSGSRSLSAPAQKAIDHADRIGIPMIAVWELAVMVERGRITARRPLGEWLEEALAQPRVELLPLTPAIASLGARFGSAIPGDPADRMILATAMEYGAALVTKDSRLAETKLVRTIW